MLLDTKKLHEILIGEKFKKNLKQAKAKKTIIKIDRQISLEKFKFCVFINFFLGN